MDIKTVLEMDDEVKGLKVHGEVGFIGELKKHQGKKGEWTSQFIAIKDSDDSIGISLNNAEMDKSFKGKVIEFSGCKVGSYIDKDGKTKKSLSCGGTYQIYEEETKPIGHKADIPEPDEKPVESKPEAPKPVSMDAKPDWDCINLRKDRNICLAYAKDLAMSGKITIDDITNYAEKFVNYVYFGINKLTDEQIEQIKNEAKDEEIPF